MFFNFLSLKQFFTARVSYLLIAALTYNTSALASTSNDTIEAAVAERRAGDVKKSIEALLSVQQRFPNNLRAKVELASSYYAIAKFDRARALIDEVLINEDLPDTVRSNITRFSEQINFRIFQNQKFPANYRNKLSLFSGYDSNANIAPDDALLDIGRLNESSTEKSDDFIGVIYDASYQVPLDLGSLLRHETMKNRGGITLYSKDYGDIDRSDMQVINLFNEIDLIARDNWLLKTKATLTHVRLDDDSLVNYYRLTGDVGYRFGRSLLFFTVEGKDKHYFDSEDDGKEGLEFSQALHLRVKLPHAIDVTLGVRHADNDVEDLAYSYKSNRYSIAAAMALSERVRFRISSYYTKSHYQGIEKHYSSKRRDSAYRHSASLSYLDLFKNIDAEVSYTAFSRQSNNDIHTYDRNVVMVSLKYDLD